MQLRDATPDDAADLRAVFVAAGGDVGSSFEADLTYVARCGRLLVASVGGAIAGFGGVIDLPSTAFVTDLFVHPDHQGRRVGTALLDELLRDRPVRTTFSSSHPAALRAYAQNGMQPRWRLRYLEGVVPSDVETERLGPLVDVAAPPRPGLWAHLRELGAEIVDLPGGVVAALFDDRGSGEGGSGASVVRVARLAPAEAADDGAGQECDHAEADRSAAATMHALWRHLGPGRTMLVHVREATPIARLLDAAGFVEVDADTCCSTLAEPFPGQLGFHPGLA